MRKSYIIFDGNSLGHRAQNMGNPMKLGAMHVQAIYHFLQTMRSYCAKYSFATPVVLWDGFSWRKLKHIKYKESRDLEETKYQKEQAEARKHYKSQVPHIQKALSFLGITQVVAQNMEADDLAAIMSDLYHSQGALVTLVSEDRDWLQLIRDGVSMERPRTKDRITLKNFEEVTGVPTPSMYVEVKAMMGDKGDDIDGIGGLGIKRATDLVKEYGSFHKLLSGVMIERTIDPATLPKYLRDLVDNEEKVLAFDFNMSLVDLRSPVRPAVQGLRVDSGEANAENFKSLCVLLLFNSFLTDFENWISVFPVGRAQAFAA